MDFLFAFDTTGGGVTGGGVTGGGVTGGGVTGGATTTGGVFTGGATTTGGVLTGGATTTGGVTTGGVLTGVETGVVLTGLVVFAGEPAVAESGVPLTIVDLEPTVVMVVVAPAPADAVPATVVLADVADRAVAVTTADVLATGVVTEVPAPGVVAGVVAPAMVGAPAVVGTPAESAVSVLDSEPERFTVPMTVPTVLVLLATGVSLELLLLPPQPVRGRIMTSEVRSNDFVVTVLAATAEETE